MWRLIFFFFNVMNIFGLIYPFLVKFDLRVNILRLKGTLTLKIFNKIKFEFTFRIKNGYIYINHKNKIRKEKLSNSNFNIVFIYIMVKELYFREQFLSLELKSNFGYNPDSCVTAVGSGAIDVISKSIFMRIKNNKKSSHIFVNVEPKYNQDIFNIRLVNEVRISVFDILFSLFYTAIYTWSYYERKRTSKS